MFACLCFSFLLFSCRNEPTQEIGLYTGYTFPDTAEVVKTESSNVYYADRNLPGTLEGFYLEGYDSIPFITEDSFSSLLQIITGVSAENVTITQSNSAVTLTCTDTIPNVSLTFDVSAQTISSADFIHFCSSLYSYDETDKCDLVISSVKKFVR